VSGSFRRGLLALTVAGLAVRLFFLVFEPPTPLVADEWMWTTWGAKVLPSDEVAFSPLKLRFVFHPPVYPYFIGIHSALFGTLEATLVAVKVTQCLLGALLVLAVGRIGAATFGDRAGLFAAGVTVFYPELVWFCSHLWAETVFAVLLWWGFERLLRADARESIGLTAAAGALFGLAILTRETVLYFLPVAAFWLAWRRSGGARRAAVLLVTALVVVLPWTLRNWMVFQTFIPVSTAGAMNLWQGNTRLSRPEVYEEYWAVRGRVQKYRYTREKSLEAILDRQPLWFLEKVRDEMPQFWAAHGQPIVHMERGAYKDVPRSAAFAAIAVVLVPYLAVLVLFVVGIAVLPRGRPAALLLAFLSFYVLLHVVAHGYPRYRVPSLPVLFLVAGQGWAFLCSRPRPALSRRRLASAAGVALVLALSVGPSLTTWATEPWPPEWAQGGEEEPLAEPVSPGGAPERDGR
jgi:4-amino-4-deoxy-L-arabinose transferase-like glycosyltransferase